MTPIKRTVRRGLERVLASRGLRITPVEAPDPARLWDKDAVLPPGADEALRDDHPRLAELRRRYAELDWPVCVRGRWRDDLMHGWLDLRYFRGDNPYVWQYREQDELASRLKFFVFLRYVMERDSRGLIERLGEDGAFGVWTYRFDGYPVCSRDLLDSANELAFLDRAIGLLDASPRILDIGAGYGRLAHRAAQSVQGLRDHCCVDAIPESTFLAEYYTQYRGISPPVRVVPLDEVPALEPGSFDLAFNVHSFSECSLGAIRWWLEHLVRLGVPRLFLVPNEADGFLSTEPDGTRVDYGGAISQAGYRLVAEERKFTDPAVRELVGIDDRYCLFELDR